MIRFLIGLFFLMAMSFVQAGELLSNSGRQELQALLDEAVAHTFYADYSKEDFFNFSKLAHPSPIRMGMINSPGIIGGSGNTLILQEILSVLRREFKISVGSVLLGRNLTLAIVPRAEIEFYPAEAYSRNGETYIIMAENELTAEVFALRLLHEIAILSDALVDPFSDKDYIAPYCNFSKAINNPIIATSLATLRAYEFEKKILVSKEVFINPSSSLAQISHMNCVDKVTWMVEQVYKNIYAHPLFMPESPQVTYFCMHNEKPAETLKEDLQMIFSMKGRVGASFCDQFLEPRLVERPTLPPAFEKTAGPRPRVGTGW